MSTAKRIRDIAVPLKLERLAQHLQISEFRQDQTHDYHHNPRLSGRSETAPEADDSLTVFQQRIFCVNWFPNASDACDKLRFEALQNPGPSGRGSDFSISLSADKEAGTVTITDNGIGMSKDEVVQFLGTVASSGTREYLNAMTGDQKKTLSSLASLA